MPEFVELINATVFPIDLADCTLSDRPTSGGSVNVWKLEGHAFRIPGGKYAVLVADSSGTIWFPSLRAADPGLIVSMDASGLGFNNEGDELVLRSAGGVVLDSVAYAPSFHTPDITDTKGRSLELYQSGTRWLHRQELGNMCGSVGGNARSPQQHYRSSVSFSRHVARLAESIFSRR